MKPSTGRFPIHRCSRPAPRRRAFVCDQAVRSLPPDLVLSRSDILAEGWSDPAIARAVRSGRLLRLRRGYFLHGAPEHRHFAIAAARACTGSAISHRSAAQVVGIPLLGEPRARPDLTVPPKQRGTVAGALLHRATFDAADASEYAGVRVLKPARTALDLARDEGVHPGVIAMDDVLHRGLATRDELERIARQCWNWPGIRRATHALSLADARAESVLESISRLALGGMALPPCVPQQLIRDERAYPVGRVDFSWARYGVVGECDGLIKYDSRAVLNDEKRRQEGLEQLGLVVIRWGWEDITKRPRQVEVRLQQGLDRAKALRRSGSPRYWSVNER